MVLGVQPASYDGLEPAWHDVAAAVVATLDVITPGARSIVQPRPFPLMLHVGVSRAYTPGGAVQTAHPCGPKLRPLP